MARYDRTGVLDEPVGPPKRPIEPGRGPVRPSSRPKPTATGNTGGGGTGGTTRSGPARPGPAAEVRWGLPLAVVVVGMFMSVLDTSIVNVAIPSMQKEYGASLTDIEWVATAYTLCLGVIVPTSAWLARAMSPGCRFRLLIVPSTGATISVRASSHCAVASAARAIANAASCTASSARARAMSA